MQVIINAPLQSKTLQADWVEFNTSVGNFVIQTGHAPMLLSLACSKPFSIGLSSGQIEHFMVHTSGFVQITPQIITILVGSINPHSVD